MMPSHLFSLTSAVGLLAAVASAAPQEVHASAIASGVHASASSSATATYGAPPPAFTYNATHFLKDGKPYQILGGQMDPQRIHPAYWRDRLSKAKALGLNTIFSYVFWDELEPVKGQWLGDKPNNDVAKYFKIAQEEGLNVVLRPGPYICGEHEWGGFPAWLSQVPGLVVRTYNQPFLDAAKGYIQNLAKTLAPLQASNGGPILMVQVENEYGSFGHDQNYTKALRDILKESFNMPLYTNDGGSGSYLKGGIVPGVLAETDGGVADGYAARDKYVTDPSELGPQLDGEYYTTWLDLWGVNNGGHQSYITYGQDYVNGVISDIDYVASNSSRSISLYMVHGGTNFGYEAGALWQNKTLAVTSSYDYGAPIDETGRSTDFYKKIRDVLVKYNKYIPDVPANIPLMAIPEFKLKQVVPLFSTIGNPTKTSHSPVTMEELGQAHGFVLYSHTATTSNSGAVQPGDRARDRVLVYVNNKLQGVIDSTYKIPNTVSVSLKKGDKLDLFVENLGRYDYWNQFTDYENVVHDPYKGIVGEVTIGGTQINGWDITSVPIDQVQQQVKSHSNGYGYVSKKPDTPLFYSGTFTVPKSLADNNNPATRDTLISLAHGVKGNVWVNGFHLGRYWAVGPQQSLYLPGAVLNRSGSNEVIVLELEPNQTNGTMSATGITDREWFTQNDVDCPGCTS
ncbi:glycoside hydrolase family 35 protein [Acrodontium crateriforme]|uniref:Beta-galactosidase n=1 Tax=Acrodontium crateriforme TaxID=150365 RepID=A0AAQ3MAS2_9PEZI|nr:glycoside hydrolase family 35 protein [Acrodontium crateriforme]